jgi:hypothetical protein
MKRLFFLLTVPTAIFFSCKKEGCTDANAVNYNQKANKDDGSCEYAETGPYLIIKLKFDSLQPRLDNFGQPATLPSDHSAQSPKFHSMSAHYIELAQNQWTALQTGEIIYRGAETSAGGSFAADFDKAIIKGDGEVFKKIPLKNIAPGTYEWLRVSLTYQNFDLKYKYQGVSSTGRLASFVGWNTYIKSHKIRSMNEQINANKLQGYWAFEDFGIIINGQAAGTTVVNPLHNTSPIPAGSCIVTGNFDTPFTLVGNETSDIVMTLSLSTNKSFEWYDANQDGVYEPAAGDYPVDMGLRGLKPIIE